MSSPKKIVAVIGVTGNQGKSVVASLLRTGTYTVRALTRDPTSDKVKPLVAQGVEIVKADCLISLFLSFPLL